MKFYFNIAIALIIFCGGLAGGWFGRGAFIPDPTPGPVVVDVVKTTDKKVKREIKPADNRDVIISWLLHYDNDPMNITYNVNALHPQYTDLTVRWSLYEREGEQQIKVPVYQSGNWKFYAVGGVAAVAGGLTVYKLLH